MSNSGQMSGKSNLVRFVKKQAFATGTFLFLGFGLWGLSLIGWQNVWLAGGFLFLIVICVIIMIASRHKDDESYLITLFPFLLQYMLFTIFDGALFCAFLISMGNSKLNTLPRVLIAYLLAAVTMFLFSSAFYAIVAYVTKKKIKKSEQPKGIKASQKRRVDRYSESEIRRIKIRRLFLKVIAFVTAFSTTYFANVATHETLKNNSVVDPHVVGEQITAEVKERFLGKTSAADASDVFYDFLKMTTEYHDYIREAEEYESTFNVKVETYPFVREDDKGAPYSVFLENADNRYTIGGYFSLMVTNPYDYDVQVQKFGIQSSNVIIKESPEIILTGYVEDYYINVFAYNNGWATANNVELTFKDLSQSLNLLWSGPELVLTIPSLSPGEYKRIQLLAMDYLTTSDINMIQSRTGHISVQATCKEALPPQSRTTIQFTIYNGAFSAINGVGVSTATIKYGVVIRTKDNIGCTKYPTRDLIPAGTVCEFLIYLASDMTCDMSLQFYFELSDGNRLISPVYDNIRISVPYYEQYPPFYDGQDIPQSMINNHNVEILYPFKQNGNAE